MSWGNETEEYEMEVRAITDMALLFKTWDDDEIWLPKSQISWDGEPIKGELLTVEIPNWLAEEKGLI